MNGGLPDNPFVGLRPFRSEEALLFFGRRQQTAELLEHLHRTHFLAVMGSSGCGKSSLIRAGLIPNLAAGFLVEDRDQWVYATMTPGETPLARLAAEFETSESALREKGASSIVEKLLQKPNASSRNCLLLVDQFEEIFRFAASGRGKDEAADFVSVLLALVEQREFPVFVVLTMRSDFLGDCDAFYGLPEALNRSHYLVPRLTRQQRRESIEGPVRLFGRTITRKLVERVLNDLGDDPDQLPVMEHALMRTWERCQRDGSSEPMDLAHYTAIGGVKEALSRDAESALEGMSSEELRLTAQIFQALTDTDASNRKVRRPVRLSELEAITQAPRERIKSIVERFRDAGRCFLILQDDPISQDVLIDISHESLIRQWKTLRGWAGDEAESKLIYLDLVKAVDRRRALFHDSDLQIALDWRARKNPTEAWARRYDPRFTEAMGFLDASRDQSLRETHEHDRQKAKRAATTAVLGILVLGVALTGFTWVQTNQAGKQIHKLEKEVLEQQTQVKDQKEKADKDVRQLRAENEKQMTEGRTKALAEIDSQKKEIARVNEEAGAFLRAKASWSLLSLATEGVRDTRDAIDVSALLAIQSLQAGRASKAEDRRALESEGRHALIEALKLMPPKPIRLEQAHQGPITAMAADVNGRLLVTAGMDGKVILWDVAKQKSRRTLTETRESPLQSLAVSMDGQWVAAASLSRVFIWSQEDGKLVRELPLTGVSALAFSADRSRLAVAFQRRATRRGLEARPYSLFSTADWNVVPIENPRPTLEVAFSSENDLVLVTETIEGEKRKSGIRLASQTAGDDDPLTSGCHSVRFNPEGKLLAACPTGVLLFDLKKGFANPVPIASTRFENFAVNRNFLIGLLTPNKAGSTSPTPDIEEPVAHSVSAFETSSGSEFLRLPEPVTVLASPLKGEWVATGNEDGTLAFWRIARAVIPDAPVYKAEIADLTFGHREPWLAVVAKDGSVRLLDPENGKLLHSLTLPDGRNLTRPEFNADDSILAVLGTNELHLIRTADWTLLPHNVKVRDKQNEMSFTFSDEGRTILVAEKNSVRRFRISPSWTELQPSIETRGADDVISVSEDRQWIHVGPRGKGRDEGQVWSADSGSPAKPSISDWIRLWPDPDEIRLTGDMRGGAWTLNYSSFSTPILGIQDEDRHQVAELEHNGKIKNLAISRAGNWIAVVTDLGQKAHEVFVWPWGLDGLIERACQLLPRNLTAEEWKNLGLEKLSLGPYRKTCENLPLPLDRSPARASGSR